MRLKEKVRPWRSAWQETQKLRRAVRRKRKSMGSVDMQKTAIAHD
jgi:hypothetical protein